MHWLSPGEVKKESGLPSLMREAADEADVDPDRLSFMRSLRVIRRQVTDQADFSP
ncbi:hypothetical protein [Frankia sp. QA3]|uniref:hypothetical protein n=1 Tax=Frankia sp. QA3 TaxID=710111 RepID=UPI0002D85854|nr:hypothetical protein [Frankia sp. QA3]